MTGLRPWRSGFALEPQAAYAGLVPAEVVGDLVAHGSLDLLREQLGLPAEVAHEGVLVDDDPLLVAPARDGVPVVVPVGVELAPALRHDHRHVAEDLLEVWGQAVERLGHDQLELGRLAGPMGLPRQL